MEVTRKLGDAPEETTASRELTAKFDKTGEWSTIDQTGDVHFHDAQRTGQGDRAHVDRATNIVTLDGSVIFADATTRTTAQSASFAQGANTLRADGHVLTTDLHPSAGQHFESRAGARAHFGGTPRRGHGARARGVLRKRKIVAGAVGDRGRHDRIGQPDAHCAGEGPSARSIPPGGVESEAGRAPGQASSKTARPPSNKARRAKRRILARSWGMSAEDC